MEDPACFPIEWVSRRSFIGNPILDGRFPLPDWIPIAQWRVVQCYTLPPDIALATVAALSRTSSEFSLHPQLHLLWRSSIVAFSDHPPATTAQLTGESRCADTF